MPSQRNYWKFRKHVSKKERENEKSQMTEECNCLPLKCIFNLSTENLLEHFVFVQVMTEFGPNAKCCRDGLGEQLQKLCTQYLLTGRALKCDSCSPVFAYGHCLLSFARCTSHWRHLSLCVFVILKIMSICPWNRPTRLHSELVIVFSLRRVIAAVSIGWHSRRQGAVYGSRSLLWARSLIPGA